VDLCEYFRRRKVRREEGKGKQWRRGEAKTTTLILTLKRDQNKI
jgi:hypothetical protein